MTEMSSDTQIYQGDSVKTIEQPDGAISVVLKLLDCSRERGRDGLQDFTSEAQEREHVARRAIATVGVAIFAKRYGGCPGRCRNSQ